MASSLSPALLFCSTKDNIFITATSIRITTWFGFLKSTVIFQYLSCFWGEQTRMKWVMMGNMSVTSYRYSKMAIITVIHPAILFLIPYPGQGE